MFQQDNGSIHVSQSIENLSIKIIEGEEKKKKKMNLQDIDKNFIRKKKTFDLLFIFMMKN